MISLCLGLNIQAQTLADLFDEVSQSVVVIGTIQNKYLGGGDKKNVTTESGVGSGVLIGEDGLIWTAAHVVQVAEELKVKFKDGSIHDARVLSSSPTTDLALIQVIGNVSDKKIARIGDSDKARVGDDIFVIGAPKGLEYSLSRGIISGRVNEDEDGFGALNSEFIQVDAAINPGNSGGPLFNMQGEVIGIASFILTESGGFEGIGFAATSNMAHRVLSENRVYGGLEVIRVTGPVAKALNVPGEGGYLVTKVSSKGLGAQIGMQGGTINAEIEGQEVMLGGDIILELAGISLANADAGGMALDKIGKLPKGTEVEIKFLRGGEIITRKFTLM